MTEQNEFVLRGPEPFEPLPGDTLGQMIYKSLTNVNTQKNEAFVSIICKFLYRVILFRIRIIL